MSGYSSKRGEAGWYLVLRGAASFSCTESGDAGYGGSRKWRIH
jgi:hypothetical protein